MALKTKARKKKPARKIYIVCGGTGGHCFPALAVIEYLLTQNTHMTLAVDPRGQKYFHQLVGEDCIDWFRLNLSSPSQAKFSYFFGMIWGTLQALLKLSCARPHYVISFGGYTSFPMLAACFILRIPYFLQEQNAKIGRVNRLFLPYARAFFYGLYLDTPPQRAHFLGNPVRKDFIAARQIPYPSPCTQDQWTILIIGGSQGTHFFSSIIPEAVAELPIAIQKHFVIYHHCRKEDEASVKKRYQDLPLTFHVSSFFDPIAPLIAQSSLVICRAGAMSMSELLVVGRPAIYIPYPQAQDDHQTKNAQFVDEQKGGWLLPQPKASIEELSRVLNKLFSNPTLLEQAAQKAFELGKPEATEILVKTIDNCLPMHKKMLHKHKNNGS